MSVTVSGKVDHVIVDAGAIIKGQLNTFHQFGTRFYTTPEIIWEIRDKKAREKLSSLPFDLEIKTPSDVGMHKVSAFAQESGDFTQLSLNDLKLLALTYDLEVQMNSTGSTALKTFSVVDHSTQTARGMRLSSVLGRKDTGINEAEDGMKVIGPGGCWNKLEVLEKIEGVRHGMACDKHNEEFVTLGKEESIFVNEDFPSLADLISALPERASEYSPFCSTLNNGNSKQSTASKAYRQKIEAINIKQQPRIPAEESIIEKDGNHLDTSISMESLSTLNPSFSAPYTSRILSGGVGKRNTGKISFDEDDNLGWITSSNIAHCKATGAGMIGGTVNGMKKNSPAQESAHQKVACLTTDYTMQNVLMRMKIGVMSIDGMVIKTLRRWVLRCGACFQVHCKMDLLFCSKCGSHLMQRIAASIDHKTGKLRLHLKMNYVPKTKGSKCNLPLPGKQGKYDGELLLREDQLLVGIWRQKIMKIKKDVKSAFGEEIASGLGVHINKGAKVKVGLGHEDPNSMKGRRRRGRKKK